MQTVRASSRCYKTPTEHGQGLRRVCLLDQDRFAQFDFSIKAGKYIEPLRKARCG